MDKRKIKKQFCIHGHDIFTWGRDRWGICNGCNLKRRSEWHKLNSKKVKIRQRKWRENNKEFQRIRNAEWCKNNPEKYKIIQKRASWKRRGIINSDGTQFTLDNYQQAYNAQYGSCKICNVNAEKLTRGLEVDHNHKTGIFRSLLCLNCNTALGNGKENIVVFESIISYLKNHG